MNIEFNTFNEKEKAFHKLLKQVGMNDLIPATTKKGKVKLLENGKTFKNDYDKILYDLDIVNYICEVNFIESKDYPIIGEIMEMYN